ncbi:MULTISPECIES: SGNH/GDSL hydrolase family protein [Streptomyces]|uniref:GDSL-like Lipase/Acylhydrolase n=1 Tax=Streptomyces chartreusis NRRL 3882 TaxID=1079985 RepID=A0A2N9BDU1_STRCX|nr:MULTISPECIES: SGNH/GDSL hydrolase family protein [Streptomyces]MYS88446.1 SGNH/GDSL hydrolase family protein [Streptomyces sp. SID5464]SOR81548.1 GDSL-like Lipase/Acylhydrolase [Streptomyces chartreusis NRRL 3882]
MTRGRGYALLAVVVAAIVALSTAIYVGVASDDGTPTRNALTGDRLPNNSAAPASTGTWVGTWSTSPAAAEPGTETTGMADRSVRNVVHTSVGGTSARVTLSNLYGQSPLNITRASIAVAAGSGTAAALSDTLRQLTFNGGPTVVIPPGRQVMSDAVRIAIPHDADVLITTYTPTSSGPVTYHPHARQISYVAQGDHTADATGAPYTEQTMYWRYVTALDVLSNESDGTVVVLGDSLTDGITSTAGANNRWTDVLYDKLRAEIAAGRDLPRYSVVNQGISGNRVLTDGLGRPADNPSGLNRFGRDVLERTNVKVVVIDLGVNDILRNPRLADPNAIVGGLRTLVEQAHARGLKVVGATLMPFGGHRGYSEAREAVRQQINAEIRAGRVFDAVVDFDKALRDPYDPRRLRADYDSGDHLHPSDKGYARMAEAFDLETLKGSVPAEL